MSVLISFFVVGGGQSILCPLVVCEAVQCCMGKLLAVDLSGELFSPEALLSGSGCNPPPHTHTQTGKQTKNPATPTKMVP